MRPSMGDDDRHLLSAAYELDRGRTPAQAVEALQRRFGYLDEQQALAIVGRASASLLAAVQLATAQPGEELAALPNVNVGERAIINVDATVTMEAPGRQAEYRLARISVPANATAGDVAARLQAVVDDWLSRYGADGRTASYDIRSVF